MVVNGKKQRSVPASRARYEKSHPTVTIRVDLELDDELKLLKKTAGMSLADVLRVGLEKAKPVAGNAWDRGYEAALADCFAAVCRTCQDRVIELLPVGG